MDYNYREICSKIENEGYCLIDKFWDDTKDAEINKFYENSLKPLIKKTSIDKFGNRNFSVADDEIKNNPFKSIKNSEHFQNLITNVLKINNIKISKKLDIHNIIAFQKNELNKNTNISSNLHFDAFYLTIIIPIKKSKNTLPGRGGSLILYPNIRGLASNSIFNYTIKLFTQNFIFRKIIRNQFLKKYLNYKVVSSEEKKLLIFYGYKSLHGNEAILDKNYKVHSIFHIYNPHKDSIIDKWIFKRNANIRKNKLI